jgi:hypothetical protein
MLSKRTPVRTRRTALRLFISAVGVVCLCRAAVAGESTDTPAGPSPPWPTTFSKIGNADHQIGIVRYPSFDSKTCAGREPSAIDLDVPPAHGIVCLRYRNDRPILFSYPWPGAPLHCRGKIVPSLGVIYLPYRGYTGPDTFRYTVRGHNAITYTANVTVVPDVPPSPNAMPADIAPAGDIPQAPGPIHPCAELVS